MKQLLLLMMTVVFLTVGCGRKDETPIEDLPEEGIQVPDGFTFETTRELDITIKMPPSIDFKNYRGRFDLYTVHGSKSKLVYSGSFDENGIFTGKIKIPTAVGQLRVVTIAGEMLLDVPEEALKGGGLEADFSDEYVNNPPDSVVEGFKNSHVAINASTGYNHDQSRVVDKLSNGDFEINDFGNIWFWNSPHPVDGKWYITYRYPPAEYYNDGGNHVVRTPYTNGYYAGGVSQMIDVTPGQTVTFVADIKATISQNSCLLKSWLYLIPYDAAGSPLDYFAIYYPDPADTWTTKQVVATMPANTVKCQVLFWAHDVMVNESVMFDNAHAYVSGPDTDGDGVDDDDDDYPNDPTRAFNVYYPNATDWGTLAFEDLWPGKGDYDFNDLVYDYHFKSVLNAQNELVEFYNDYSIRAIGASFENGFGFMLGGDPSNVASVTGTHLTENYINLNANGTVSGQSNTVIILYDNTYSAFNIGNIFINTQPDMDYYTPDTSQLHVVYSTPVATSITGTAPYNPFLIVNKNRGQEVHLAGQLPTDLADVSFFGEWADDTDPANGKYYQTVNNLPWALDLPVPFEYPYEKVDITAAYNHFVEWAESAGNEYPDWYEDQAGYRNSENIYAVPE